MDIRCIKDEANKKSRPLTILEPGTMFSTVNQHGYYIVLCETGLDVTCDIDTLSIYPLF